MDENQSCAFTGHRPERLPWGYEEEDSRCLRFKMALDQHISTLYTQGIRHFISGMALGTDQYFAESVLTFQETHPEITLECAIPCISQANAWSEEQQNRYHRILEQSQFETMVQHDYSAGCMMRRNRYLVNRAGTLLAAYDGTLRGGTAKTIAYAMKKERNILILSVNGEEFR